jgi:hypothetical protein
MPGYIPGWLGFGGAAMPIGLGALSTVLFVPIVYLSQLDLGEPWGVLSGRIFASLGRCFGSWLLFYIEIVLLWGGCAALCLWMLSWGVHVSLLPPLVVAAVILYGRLLGRLAWKLAESMPANAD